MIWHMPVCCMSQSIAGCLYASVCCGRVEGFLVCMEPGQDFGNGLLMNEGSPVDRLLAGFIVGHLDILPCVRCNCIANMLILHLWEMHKVMLVFMWD